jgi:hypothetical protein
MTHINKNYKKGQSFHQNNFHQNISIRLSLKNNLAGKNEDEYKIKVFFQYISSLDQDTNIFP